MTYGSGLGATLGLNQEATVGTFTSSGMRWLPFKKEGLKKKKGITQSQALHGGLYELSSKRAYTTRTVDGAVDFELTDRQLGLLLKNMIGSSPTLTQEGSTAAWLQTHTPGDTEGMSMCAQVGRPEVSGTVSPFSYNGLKITDWELAVALDQIGTLSCTFDGWDESTSQGYAAASFVTPTDVLHFAEATLLLGGTVSTTGGIASVTGSTAAATARSVSIKGSNPLNTKRFFLGSSGTKAEQLVNGFRKITGSAVIEFENLTDVYNAFAADTATALELQFVGKTIAAGYQATLTVLIPNVFFDEGPPVVDGPEVLTQNASFTGLDDGTDPPIQFQYISLDTAV